MLGAVCCGSLVNFFSSFICVTSQPPAALAPINAANVFIAINLCASLGLKNTEI